MENFSELHSICIQVFESIAGATSIFILPLFLGKVVFSNIVGEGSKVFAALKGVVIYFFSVAAFPMMLEVLFSIPEAFLPNFSSLSSFVADSPGMSLSSIPFSLDRILEVILSGLYWVVYYLHVFFMLLMCSMAPIVFLLSAVLGVGLGLEIFMGLLVVGSSWPIIWYGFDQVHLSLVSNQSDAFGAKCLELLITGFKGLAPVSFAALAVKSPVGKAITQSASNAVAAAKFGGFTAPMKTASVAKSTKASMNKYFEKRKSTQSKEAQQKQLPSSASTNRLQRAQTQVQEKGEKQNENSQARNLKA